MVFISKKLTTLLKYIFFCFTSTVLLLQCASIQSPGGGEKDANPPTVLRSIPKQAENDKAESFCGCKYLKIYAI